MTEIDHRDLLLQRFSSLYMNPLYSDVTFIVDLERIPAHRMILATHSEYFRVMLYGHFSESQNHEINLPVPLQPFQLIIKYIYTGQMTLNVEHVPVVFELSHLYGLATLEKSIIKYLENTLSLETALCTQHMAAAYGANELLSLTECFIDGNAEHILQQKNYFNRLSQDFLQTLLQKDSFYAKELNIFLAVKEWCAHNPNANMKNVMMSVRFPLIDEADLMNIVRPSGLLDEDKLLQAVQMQRRGVNLPDRGIFARCVEAAYINEETLYDLLHVYRVNYIYHTLSQVCSYCIQMSTDKINWHCAIDYSMYKCSARQCLHFPTRPVRYIRFVSIYRSKRKLFAVSSKLILRYEEELDMHEQIIAPILNMVRQHKAAVILSDVFNRIDNNCVHFNFGVFQLTFGQPFYINSIRLFFPHMRQGPSFNIKTSANGKKWLTAVGSAIAQGDQWTHFTFAPRIVMYIRFNTTRKWPNSQNRCFIQCPSQDRFFLGNKIKSLQCQKRLRQFTVYEKEDDK